MREALENVPIAWLMQTRLITVEPDLRVTTAVEGHLMPGGRRAFPVLDNGRFVGIVCLQDIRKVDWDDCRSTAVGDIMTPAEAVAQGAPDENAAPAMSTLSQRQRRWRHF